VLAAAALVLHLEPANGRIPAIGGGVAMMLVVNLVLMRRAVTPLERLTDLMRRVDPLRPGERIPAPRAESEVSVLSQTFNEMLDRLEAERREGLHRALSEREAERRRVADELHDQIGQNLTALALQLDRLHIPRMIVRQANPRLGWSGGVMSMTAGPPLRGGVSRLSDVKLTVPRGDTRETLTVRTGRRPRLSPASAPALVPPVSANELR
jgi:HAMP domain-containing protein